MGWSECISRAISYIEDNITEELSIEEIAKQAMLSPFYFQKGFAMLCGYTVGEYVKKRRLALAGSELVSSDTKVIDIALKYGYDSPGSFTKAFTRFHGATPASVRKGEAMIRSFSSLKVKLIVDGGYSMEYKLVKKDAFTVIGVSEVCEYEEAETQVPQIWADYFRTGKDEIVHSVYGISIDENRRGDEFEFMIGDHYNPAGEVREGFTTKVIPAYTWAVFACRGAGSVSIREVNKKIFSEWLPGVDYEIAAGYNIEMYSDPAGYPKGVEDETYYCEIWIPVRKKDR